MFDDAIAVLLQGAAAAGRERGAAAGARDAAAEGAEQANGGHGAAP